MAKRNITHIGLDDKQQSLIRAALKHYAATVPEKRLEVQYLLPWFPEPLERKAVQS